MTLWGTEAGDRRTLGTGVCCAQQWHGRSLEIMQENCDQQHWEVDKVVVLEFG